MSSIHVKNIKVSKYLILHSIINYHTFPKLRSVTLCNLPIQDELLILFLNYLSKFSLGLEKLEIEKIPFTDSSIEALCEVLTKCKTKILVIKECNLQSKQMGKMCLGILEMKTVENIDFSNNAIGKP